MLKWLNAIATCLAIHLAVTFGSTNAVAAEEITPHLYSASGQLTNCIEKMHSRKKFESNAKAIGMILITGEDYIDYVKAPNIYIDKKSLRVWAWPKEPDIKVALANGTVSNGNRVMPASFCIVQEVGEFLPYQSPLRKYYTSGMMFGLDELKEISWAFRRLNYTQADNRNLCCFSLKHFGSRLTLFLSNNLGLVVPQKIITELPSDRAAYVAQATLVLANGFNNQFEEVQ
jgi:hypothetical protein